MRTPILLGLSALSVAFTLLGASVAPPPAPAKPAATAPARPNFIFIQGEAQGWSSLSVDMDGKPPSHARPEGLTPNLEKLAADGARLSDFYVSCPRCTPSRASFVTGISPAKLHMTYQAEGAANRRDNGRGEDYSLMRTVPPTPETNLPPGVKTTGAWLGELGYASAHFGKWHVTRSDPTAVGFTVSDGPNSNQGPERGVAPNPKQAVAITDRGIEFMREQVKAGKPFYLQIDHYGFGAEEEATPEALAAARERVPNLSGKPLGAVAGARDVDTQVGRIRAALEELGIADRTYIFYSADHGAQGGGGGSRNRANPPFTGAKGSVSEGGIRVPFIAVGPGIEPGTISAVRATGMDLVPTLLDLAGSPLPKPEDPDARTAIEGGSLKPVLVKGGDGKVRRTREEIVIHFPHFDLGNGGPASAIYLGDHKLVRNYETGKVSLYDIAEDPAESKDLAAAMPERTKELEARLDAYLKAVRAQMPTLRAEGDAAKDDEKPAANAPPSDDRPARGQGGNRGSGGNRGGGGGGRNRNANPPATPPATPPAAPPTGT
jgi:arylsulfatase A